MELLNKPISEYSALEIAIYACNAGNSEERINEVAKMIESYIKPSNSGELKLTSEQVKAPCIKCGLTDDG